MHAYKTCIVYEIFEALIMRILTILISLSCITACSTSTMDEVKYNVEPAPVQMTQKKMSSANANLVHQHITRLANTLFSSAQDIKLHQSVAVGTFLPIDLINGKSMPKQSNIGLQIQESFITLGTQAGLNILEYRTMSSIKLQENADVMLSREIENLHTNIDAQYFLTGTYLVQENSLLVNARLIELSNQNVVAAATDYIPTFSLESKQQVTMKNNMLYRKTF